MDDEFFLIARQEGARISMLLSDMTASVEYPLAEQVLSRLGEDPPEDDELDEVLPVGDLDLFADLDLPEDEMEQILDDLDAYPEEMLESIVNRLGLSDAVSPRRPNRRGPFGELLRGGPDPRRRPVGGVEVDARATARALADVADVARDVPTATCGCVLIEQDDEYTAIVRVEDATTSRGPSSPTVTPPTSTRWPHSSPRTCEEIGEDELRDDEDAPPAHDCAPFGDADVVEDLGTSAADLLTMCAHEGTLPIDILVAICEKAGCVEPFEYVRG